MYLVDSKQAFSSSAKIPSRFCFTDQQNRGQAPPPLTPSEIYNTTSFVRNAPARSQLCGGRRNRETPTLPQKLSLNDLIYKNMALSRSEGMRIETCLAAMCKPLHLTKDLVRPAYLTLQLAPRIHTPEPPNPTPPVNTTQHCLIPVNTFGNIQKATLAARCSGTRTPAPVEADNLTPALHFDSNKSRHCPISNPTPPLRCAGFPRL
jgi:hypothetical protein